ncbi:MAG: GAF and ANTAR domain-containing protein [Jatrophihabitantaceae bacterium]
MSRKNMVGLAELFDRLGRELNEAQQRADIYRVLAEAAIRVVPGAEQAGITQGKNGSFKTCAPTDDVVGQIDQIQYELKSGPCVDAIIEESVFNAPDLREDRRWPEFGRRAFEDTGVISMLSFRLFFEDDSGVLAAINMYSAKPGAFDDASRAIGLLLSTHGALALSAVMANDKADNLLVALQTSREIGVAMGVLMASQKVTREHAFHLLRIASQHSHRRIADIALDVAETGELALPILPLD